MISGSWTTLPPAPIPGRSNFSFVWSGSEVIVWGGYTSDALPPEPEGAAFDPIAASWRVLPDSGLRPRSSAQAAWTGRELVVWGGVTADTFVPLDDGAIYDPATDEWRPLPPSPLPATGVQASFWSGLTWWVATAEPDPGDGGTRFRIASFDPRAGTWTSLPGIDIATEAILAFGGSEQEPLALVLPLEGAAELHASTATGWTSLAPPPFDGGAVGEQPIWTGRQLVASAAAPSKAEPVAGTPFVFDVQAGNWHMAGPPPGAARTSDPLWTGRLAIYLSGPEPSPAYDPATGLWSTVDGAGPDIPSVATAVWAGDRIISWGGSSGEEITPSNVGSQFLPDDDRVGVPPD